MLQRRMKEEADLFTFQGDPPLLLLLDRRDDPVTPLLLQWTYQVIHCLICFFFHKLLRIYVCAAVPFCSF